MRIAMIGAGNAANALGRSLKKGGARVKAVWSRDPRKAKILAKKLGASAYTHISLIPKDLDLYLIAVKDDEVRNIVSSLNPGRGIVAHLSGSLEMDVFKKKFRNYGVLWPVMTFNPKNRGRELKFPVVINANSKASLKTLKQAAGLLPGKMFVLSENQRSSAHLAAVFANNFSNHMVFLSQKILRKNGAPGSLLNELILETTRLALLGKANLVQTGPAVRQDLRTMLLHRKMLKNNKLMKLIYKSVSQSIVKNKD